METILGCSMLKEMPFERHFLGCDWGQNTPPPKKKKKKKTSHCFLCFLLMMNIVVQLTSGLVAAELMKSSVCSSST